MANAKDVVVFILYSFSYCFNVKLLTRKFQSGIGHSCRHGRRQWGQGGVAPLEFQTWYH